MKHTIWIGSHNWERSTDIINGYPSFNERTQTNTQDLDDLIHWLEYTHTGYPAARQSVKQEEYWAKLIRNILCEKLIKELVFFEDNSFQCRCCLCNDRIIGIVCVQNENISIKVSIKCNCIDSKMTDILNYIECKFKEFEEY